MIDRLVLLGATGDLCGRFVLPALAGLLAAGRLPAGFRVVAGGHEDWTDATFRDHVDARLRQHGGGLGDDARAALLAALTYRRVVAADPALVGAALAAAGTGSGQGGGGGDADAVAVYLALPAAAFPAALRSLSAVGLPAGSRVAVEKPFGDDLAGAADLEALLAGATGDDPRAGVRVDHILAMPGVRALAALRAPGGPLAPLWDADHVARLEVVWEETLGLEGRTAFYDRTGALRDVLQNHLLQVLVLATMEPPAGPGEDALHAAKADLLRALVGPAPGEMAALTRRARYGPGLVQDGTVPGGRPTPGYAAAPGVDPGRGTETWAEVALRVATPRWSGVPVVLRTGKAFGAPHKGVAVHLRSDAPAGLPPEVVVGPRLLWVELDGPGGDVQAPGELDAYAEVLTDLLGGGSRVTVTAEEAREAWRVCDPVLPAWAAGEVPLEEYPAGSAGPGPRGAA